MSLDDLNFSACLAPAPTPGSLPVAPIYDRTFHILALLTAIATFPLIFMGGLVTSHHAGISVPDWPNSYHYNMFLFPPRLWVGGILYEHTHRLMGSVVGFLSLCLAIWAWRRELKRFARWIVAKSPTTTTVGEEMTMAGGAHPTRIASEPVGSAPRTTGVDREESVRSADPTNRNLRFLTLAVLGMVIVQGVLGGLRVVLVNLDLAIVHACVAQAFFCLAALTALRSSRWWLSAPLPSDSTRASYPLVALAAVCVVAVYLQLMLGATMRHHDAGLAIPDLPLAYGKLLPPLNAQELQTVNQTRAWDLNLDPVSLQQVWLNFAHRIWAAVVTFLLTWLIVSILRSSPIPHSTPTPTLPRSTGGGEKREARGTPLRPLALLLVLLLLAQLTLGVLTVIFRKPADVASAHVATGALVLVTVWMIFTCAARLYIPRGAWRNGLRPAALGHSMSSGPAMKPARV